MKVLEKADCVIWKAELRDFLLLLQIEDWVKEDKF